MARVYRRRCGDGGGGVRWQDHIERAVTLQETHTMEDVETMLADGMAQLWQCAEGAAITEIVQYPRRKWLTIWLTGGDMDALFSACLPDIEAFARIERCDKVVLGGRKGWKRALSTHGYSEMATVCAKDLS